MKFLGAWTSLRIGPLTIQRSHRLHWRFDFGWFLWWRQ